MIKMGQRSRAWAFTINNFEDEDKKKLCDLDCQYIVFGEERGEEGTPHLQGYVYFKTLKSLKQLKKVVERGHYEVAKGSAEQNRVYCTKDGEFVERGEMPFTAGQPSAAERNKRLRDAPLNELVESGELAMNQVPVIKKARIILAQEGDSVETPHCKGVWIHGPPGTGKSHYARETYPGLYIKAQNKWWDGYQGEKVVLLDDYDTPMLGHHLKIWADKWKATGEIKGGTVNLKHELFIITSNKTPQEIWPDDDMLVRALNRRFTFIEKLIKYVDE